MGVVPLRETVVKQVQAAGVPVWHRLAPRHWHRHATGAELCFRAIFPSLAIALATVSTAAVQHNLQKHGTVACAKAISEQNCWILQRSIKCFSERLPACTTQPSLSTFLPTAFETKFCKILWNSFSGQPEKPSRPLSWSGGGWGLFQQPEAKLHRAHNFSLDRKHNT